MMQCCQVFHEALQKFFVRVVFVDALAAAVVVATARAADLKTDLAQEFPRLTAQRGAEVKCLEHQLLRGLCVKKCEGLAGFRLTCHRCCVTVVNHQQHCSSIRCRVQLARTRRAEDFHTHSLASCGIIICRWDDALVFLSVGLPLLAAS